MKILQNLKPKLVKFRTFINNWPSVPSPKFRPWAHHRILRTTGNYVQECKLFPATEHYFQKHKNDDSTWVFWQ